MHLVVAGCILDNATVVWMRLEEIIDRCRREEEHDMVNGCSTIDRCPSAVRARYICARLKAA